MKQLFHKGSILLQQMHAYPFGVLLLFLYGAIIAFAVSGVVAWMPWVLTQPHQADFVAEQWFTAGNAFLGVGGITAPVMDLILHSDTKT